MQSLLFNAGFSIDLHLCYIPSVIATDFNFSFVIYFHLFVKILQFKILLNIFIGFVFLELSYSVLYETKELHITTFRKVSSGAQRTMIVDWHAKVTK